MFVPWQVFPSWEKGDGSTLVGSGLTPKYQTRRGRIGFPGENTLAYSGHTLLNKKPNNIKHFSMASLFGLDEYLQVWLGAYCREVLLSYAPLRLALALLTNIRIGLPGKKTVAS